MRIFLWVIQILLALHTLIGALWKFSNSEQEIPSLELIPHPVWMLLAVIEIGCAVILLLPLIKNLRRKLARFVVMAPLIIAAEMILFCTLHFFSDDPNKSPMIYWLVVAGICGFLSYGRAKLITL